jgi:hypothetical protein
MSHTESREMSGWDQIISESEAMLGRVEAKAKRLRANIQVAKEAKASGEPWPTQSENQTSDSCHSV